MKQCFEKRDRRLNPKCYSLKKMCYGDIIYNKYKSLFSSLSRIILKNVFVFKCEIVVLFMNRGLSFESQMCYNLSGMCNEYIRYKKDEALNCYDSHVGFKASLIVC